MAQQENSIRVGILGAGSASESIVRCWARLAGARLSAICLDDPGLAASLAGELEVRAFADFRELIEKGEVDAIEAFNDHPGRREAVEFAISRGKHAAIHKPLALSLADARAVSSAGLRAGVKAMVMDTLLLHPFVIQAKRIMDDGRIGEVQHVRIKSNVGKGGLGPGSAPSVLKDGTGGLLLAPAFDKAALVEWLLGPIREVHCTNGKGGCIVSFKFEAAGRYGVHEAVFSPELEINYGTAAAQADDSLEITGTDGILWLRNMTALMVEAPRLMLKRKDKVSIWDDRVEYDLEHQSIAMRRHFLEVIRGSARPCCTLEQAERALAVNLAAEASMRQSRPVRISEIEA